VEENVYVLISPLLLNKYATIKTVKDTQAYGIFFR
jgi:hypothetical protein